MRTRIVCLFLVPLVLLCGRARGGEIEARVKGGDAAGILNRSIQERLDAAVGGSDPARAFSACSYQAQALTREVELRMGVRLKRTSQKLRNPGNAPDAYETALLDRFAAVARAGAFPDDVLEEAIVDGKTVYRFARPIAVRPMCLACHGTPEQISPEIRASIAEKYPGDRATGYAAGDLRGIVSVILPFE